MNKPIMRSISVLAVVIMLMGLLAGCGGTPAPAQAQPTATPAPPTATPVPPTPTPVPPTPTPIPPTPVPPTATKAPAAAPTATEAPVAAALGPGNASASDRNLVGTALTNMAKAGSFAAKMNVQDTSGTMPFAGDITMEVATVPTQSVHMVIPGQMELISIGQDSYMKLGTGPWTKTTAAPGQAESFASSLDFSQQYDPSELAKIQIDRVGSETVDGVPTDVFNLVIPGTPPTKGKVWISKADKTFVQMVIEGDTSTVTMTFSDWGKVKIEPPQM
jgi:hypothetical protein